MNATFVLVLFLLVLVGLLLYSTNYPKPSEIGRIVFFCALLALCLDAARGVGAIEHLQHLGR
jgi:hypothetical protein